MEAFEMAMRDKKKISGASDVAGLWMSTYHRQKWTQNTERTINNNGSSITTWSYDDNILKHDSAVMCVKVVVVISMVAMERTTSKDYA